MKRTSKWISSITLVASFYQVSGGRVTRLVNFRMATPWPWTPRATSSSLRSASEMRQVIEFRNSGLWRAGRWPESALEFVLSPAEILSRAHDLSFANVSAPLFPRSHKQKRMLLVHKRCCRLFVEPLLTWRNVTTSALTLHRLSTLKKL